MVFSCEGALLWLSPHACRLRRRAEEGEDPRGHPQTPGMGTAVPLHPLVRCAQEGKILGKHPHTSGMETVIPCTPWCAWLRVAVVVPQQLKSGNQRRFWQRTSYQCPGRPGSGTRLDV
ncbi:hypothetical protein [Dictyobacter aurantiacus]|uniref:hypothetical protein n=1 Tax=Dictyobacter aurantiacus TaxID=1936993 RepID=UPI000F8401EB|nr:hypothetical protein [Dictyobacter aurantiacus]